MPPFQTRISDNNPGISDINITPQIVFRILTKLKTNAAAGPDRLPPIFFHHTAQSLQYPLSNFFRSLIELHSIPAEWKTSIIIPKFKKGSPSDCNNYRPISLTCTCCKILESIISNELMQYLLDHKLITQHQHGFLKRHSTSTNLLETTHDWTVTISNHFSIAAAYIDFKSAFDRISHSKLLFKLSCYGIKGNLYHWIVSFLSNRTQSVKINSSLSKSRPVTSGVPQGSVLGPLLFILFINDIVDNLHTSTSVKLFADDIKLYSSFSNTEPSILQNQLDIIEQWSSLWQLSISYSKCSIMTIGSHKITFPFSLGTNVIAQVETVNDLGVLINSKLNFKNHIHQIVNKANQRKSLIFRCFLTRNPSHLKRAFITYTRPLLEYASTVWSPSYITEIFLIESVQRDFTKRIPGLSHLSYHERLSALGLQSLEHRRLLADLIMTYNIITGNTCTYNNLFTLSHNHNLRGHQFKISVPVSKTNFHKHFFSNRIIPAWNSLPNNLVSSPNINIFKRGLKKIDLNKFLVFPSVYD